MRARCGLTAFGMTMVVFAFAACGGDNGDATAEPGAATGSPTAGSTGGAGDLETVQSSDGSVTLEVPADALPDGVEADDLSVETLPLDEAFENTVPDSVVGAVRLLPSGTVFNEPVTLRSTIRAAESMDPGFALLVSEDSVEAIENDSVEATDDGFIVTSQIEHFSDVIYVHVNDPVRHEFDPELSNHMVGETFTIRVRVTRLDFEQEIRELNRRPAVAGQVRLRPSDNPDWRSEVRIRVHGAAELVGPDADVVESIEDGRSATFAVREATCESEGEYTATASAEGILEVRIIPIEPAGDPVLAMTRQSFGDFQRSGGRCLAPDATETPAPTSTPAPTATEASAISVTTNSAVDHPPYARQYVNTGASVLLACVSGGVAAANAIVLVTFDGAGLSQLVLEGQLDANGNAAIQVPIQNFGPFSWTVTGDVGGVPLMGGDSGTVGPEENPDACGQ